MGWRAAAWEGTPAFHGFKNPRISGCTWVPVTFENPDDYDKLSQDASLTISGIEAGMAEGKLTVTDGNGFSFNVVCNLTARQRAILMAGGLLNYTREGGL